MNDNKKLKSGDLIVFPFTDYLGHINYGIVLNVSNINHNPNEIIYECFVNNKVRSYLGGLIEKVWMLVVYIDIKKMNTS